MQSTFFFICLLQKYYMKSHLKHRENTKFGYLENRIKKRIALNDEKRRDFLVDGMFASYFFQLTKASERLKCL